MSKAAFNAANPLMKHIQQHGFEAYFVGGAVRDFYLNRTINDVDIATSATPDEIEAIFEHTIPVGKAHGTINVVWEKNNYEVTTFRTEGRYEDHRRPTDVQFVRSLYEDVARRDFTINAMAMDTNFKLYDYFDGYNDLNHHCIRTVGDPQARFTEDALRIIRGLRFQSQLNFDIEEKTYAAMSACVEDIHYLSIERIMTELEKLLLGRGIEKAFKAVVDLKIMAHIPYLKMFDWQHIHLDIPLSLSQFLAFLHIFEGQKEGIKRLKLSNQTLKEAEHLASAILRLQQIQSKEELQIWVYDYGENIASDIFYLKALLEAHEIQIANPLIFNPKIIQKIYQQLPIHNRKEVNMNGKVLMVVLDQPSGPWIKHALREIECAIVLKKVKNSRTDIVEWVKQNVKV